MRHTPRLASIDCFRGFAVLVMVLASYLFGTEDLPAWLRHAPDGRLTAVDLGAPLFIIAIGLTFGGALRRRWARDGAARALWHFMRRTLLLFAIGLAMALIQTRLGRNEGGILWGVLQTIAVAITLTLPTLFLPPLPRAQRRASPCWRSTSWSCYPLGCRKCLPRLMAGCQVLSAGPAS